MFKYKNNIFYKIDQSSKRYSVYILCMHSKLLIFFLKRLLSQ